MKIRLVINSVVNKGGKGSGHFGHAGRPGKRGGSLPGKGDTINGVTADARRLIAKHGGDVQLGFINTESDGYLRLYTPYNAAFVRDLKANIPYSMRKWDGTYWRVDGRYKTQVEKAMEGKYVVSHEMSRKERDYLRNYVSKQRFNTLRSRVNDAIPEINSKIDKLTEWIDSYSFSSRSSRKMDYIRQKALYEHTLDNANMDWKYIENLSADRRNLILNGMTKALNDL